MSDWLEHFTRAVNAFGDKVHQVKPDQWTNATPCTEWDVRALVNHLRYELDWAVPLFQGATIAEVGDRFEGDRLGDDPAATWDRVAASAVATLSEPGAIERKVNLSYGEEDGVEYLRQLAGDLVIHGWDLAKGIGADTTIDPDQVAWVLPFYRPIVEKQSWGNAFAAPVPVPDDASDADRLIAMLGRTP